MPRVKKEILPPEHCSSVKEYESSAYWRKKSHNLLEPKDTVCQICGRPRWVWMPRKKKWKCRRSSVHHITYENCPNEKREEFMILCYSCHTESHLILRYRNICAMFERMAKIVEEYFFYEGIDTFKPW